MLRQMFCEIEINMKKHILRLSIKFFSNIFFCEIRNCCCCGFLEFREIFSERNFVYWTCSGHFTFIKKCSSIDIFLFDSRKQVVVIDFFFWKKQMWRVISEMKHTVCYIPQIICNFILKLLNLEILHISTQNPL